MGGNKSCPAVEREKAAARERQAEEQRRRDQEEQRRRDDERRRAEEQRRENERRAKLQRESSARDKYTKAMKLWDDAWTLEKNDKADAAEMKFNSARNLFVEASRLHPENADYGKYAKLSQYKIEGNAAFNEALKLHEEANVLMDLGQYVEATKKYTLAKEKYRKGVNAKLQNELARFNDCIDFVNESLDSVRGAVRSMRAHEQFTVLQKLRQFINEKQGAQVVNERSGIDIVFQYLKDMSV